MNATVFCGERAHELMTSLRARFPLDSTHRVAAAECKLCSCGAPEDGCFCKRMCVRGFKRKSKQLAMHRPRARRVVPGCCDVISLLFYRSCCSISTPRGRSTTHGRGKCLRKPVSESRITIRNRSARSFLDFLQLGFSAR